ncbi:BTAD domain-containing putative transcriptional regulator [Actinoallomurus sp. NPDC052308]|uniref:AfsR/SARP family transcriptional regulator n=1 Tax=Actinoallomurus sp. NPDC052308 TaxID=3155530 RepID=UPI0034233E10
MEFQVLGAVRAYAAGRPLDLGHPRQRCVLAGLILEPGVVQPTERLIRLVWGESPPDSARNVLYGYVSRLKKLLGAHGVTLARDTGGYVLDVPRHAVDLHRFRAFVADARRADDRSTASALLREAFGLWHGTPFADLSSERLGNVRAAIEQERLEALRLCHAIELDLGHHAELLGDLRELTDDHPFDETAAGHLMLALYRCGRQADALAAYERIQRALADELGADPAPELRELHQRILRHDPNLAPAAVRTGSGGARHVRRPAQLPHGVHGFIGRDAELRRLGALAERPADEDGPGMVLTGVTGTAGVGKTSLVVHWAQRTADLFPDGQLFADLRGYDAEQAPLPPADVLGQFLRALGVPSKDIPADIGERAGLYRSVLGGRRVLVVLDNAATSDQVRPLLPGGRSCMTVFTSRRRLSGLVARNGAHEITLDVLDRRESLELLTGLVGERRVNDEPEAADQVVSHCARLPLALSIVGAKLAGNARGRLRDTARALAADDRLKAMALDDDPQAAVDAAIGLSYQALPEDCRHYFRLIGLVPGPDFTPHAIAALTGSSLSATSAALDRLTAYHLIEQHTADRYRFHDLLRLYAADRAAADEPAAVRDQAVRRLFTWYLQTAEAAVRSHDLQFVRLPRDGGDPVPPELKFPDRPAAVGWLDAERPNLFAAVHRATRSGPYALAWHLVDALRGFSRLRPSGIEWLSATEAGLEAAARHGDESTRAAMHLSVADASANLGDEERSLAHDGDALDLSRRSGWLAGEVTALGGLGRVHWARGSLHQALNHLDEALAIYRRLGHRVGESVSLGSLGRVYHDLGRVETAHATYTRALRLSQEIGARVGEALTSMYLGVADDWLGRPERAREHLHRSLAASREIDFRLGEALSLSHLSGLDGRAGRYDQAARYARQAFAVFRDTGDQRVEAECLNAMADHLPPAGHEEASAYHEKALTTARRVQYRRGEIQALIGMAAGALRGDGLDRALAHATEALVLARRGDYRAFEGEALTIIAEVRRRSGETGQAVDDCRRALEIHEGTGVLGGQARTLRILGAALGAAKGRAAAEPLWRRALELFETLGSIEAEQVRALLMNRSD